MTFDEEMKGASTSTASRRPPGREATNRSKPSSLTARGTKGVKCSLQVRMNIAT